MNFFNPMNEAKPTKVSNSMIPLEGIRFHITNLTETTLYHGMDESYEIQILNPSLTLHVLEHWSIQNASNFIEITSTNVFGAMYGLETLKQLIQFVGFRDDEYDAIDNDGERVPIFGICNNSFKLYIQDVPVYTYRGIMIDTATFFTIALDSTKFIYHAHE